jgi:hypothetical protein
VELISQTNDKFSFKYDSLVSVPKENQIVVYHKKKSGIYDLNSKQFVVPMQKAHIQYLENAQILLKLEKNTLSSFPFSQSVLFLAGKKREFNMFEHNAFYKDGLEKINEDWLLVNQFSAPVESDVPLVDQPEYNSILEGSYIYPLPFPGSEKSGLFDLKTKKWLIEPKYASVNRVGNYVLAKKDLDENGQYITSPNFNYFDVYSIIDKKIGFVRKVNITNWETDWSDLLKEALNLQSVVQLPGSFSWYKLRKSDQEKIVRFAHNYDLILEDFFPNTWFEFAEYHPSYRQQLIYSNGKILHYAFEDQTNEMVLRNTENQYAGIAAMEGEVAYKNASDSYRSDIVLSLERIENQLIVHHYFPELPAEYPLLDDYGEDSFYISKENYLVYVYPIPEPGQYLSGVYDLSSKKWLIPQKHRFILPIDNKYLAQSFDLDTLGILKSAATTQNLFDAQGNLLLKNEEIVSMNRDELMKKLFEGSSMHFANMQNTPFEFLMDESSAETVVYKIETENKQSLIRADFNPGRDLRNIEVLKDYTADFVDANFNFGFLFETVLSHKLKYNNETLEIQLTSALQGGNEFVQDSMSVLAPNFELVLYESNNRNLKDETEQVDYLISLLIRDSNYTNPTQKYYSFTTTDKTAKINAISEQVFHVYRSANKLKQHTFTRIKDLLLVQKTPLIQEHQREIIDDFDQIFYINSSYATGNSAAYRKTPNGWKMSTPNFAELNNTSYGFIAVENFGKRNIEITDIYGEYDMPQNDSLNAMILSKEPSKQLLNTNFEPFSWKGQHSFTEIEVFDFGYQIFMEPDKSIFISPSGQIISEEHFDQYSLEYGKIIGFSPTLYEYDENGDEVYDSNGQQVLRQAEKRVVFEKKP